LDSELARRTFGWAPVLTLDESVRRVWSWLLNANR
jgi:hypothetical protein